MGLYDRIAGSTQWSTGPSTTEPGVASTEPKPFKPTELEQAFRGTEPKPFKPTELEQAFRGAYRSYRVNGRPKIDVDTFFNRIRKELIGLIK